MALFKLVAIASIAIGFLFNYVALLLIPRILQRFRIAEESRVVEKIVKKAGVSSKKMAIAMKRVRKLRSNVMKANMVQMFLPLATFLLAVMISYVVSNAILEQYGVRMAEPAVFMKGVCIGPVPVEIPYSESICTTYIVWIQFLVFLLFSPWYGYLIRRTLERS